MLSKTFLSKTLSSVSTVIVCGALLGSLLTPPSWAMEEAEKKPLPLAPRTLDKMPPETFPKIFEHLPLTSMNVMFVCREWHDIVLKHSFKDFWAFHKIYQECTTTVFDTNPKIAKVSLTLKQLRKAQDNFNQKGRSEQEQVDFAQVFLKKPKNNAIVKAFCAATGNSREIFASMEKCLGHPVTLKEIWMPLAMFRSYDTLFGKGIDDQYTLKPVPSTHYDVLKRSGNDFLLGLLRPSSELIASFWMIELASGVIYPIFPDTKLPFMTQNAKRLMAICLSEICDRDSSHIKIVFQMAHVAMQNSKFETATQLFDAALEKDSSDPMSIAVCGQAYYSAALREEAKNNPDIKKVDEYFKKSAARFSMALKRGSTPSTGMLCQAGMAFFKIKEWESAATCLTLSLQQNPNLAAYTYKETGYALYMVGKQEEASEYFQKFIDKIGNQPTKYSGDTLSVMEKVLNETGASQQYIEWLRQRKN